MPSPLSNPPCKILTRSHKNTVPNRSNNTCTPCLCQKLGWPKGQLFQGHNIHQHKRMSEWEALASCSAMGKPGSCCSVCSHTASLTHPSKVGQRWQLLRVPKLRYKFCFRKTVWKRPQMYFHLTFEQGAWFMVRLSDATGSPRDKKAPVSWPAAIYSSAIYFCCLVSAAQDTQKFSGIKDLHWTGPTYRDKEIRHG